MPPPIRVSPAKIETVEPVRIPFTITDALHSEIGPATVGGSNGIVGLPSANMRDENRKICFALKQYVPGNSLQSKLSLAYLELDESYLWTGTQ